MKSFGFNKWVWSIDIRGTSDAIQAYLRFRRANMPDNEIGGGIELMPRQFKIWHHKAMCRINICLWFVILWFDYPFPSRQQHCTRCNKKVNPNLKEKCWMSDATPMALHHFKQERV